MYRNRKYRNRNSFTFSWKFKIHSENFCANCSNLYPSHVKLIPCNNDHDKIHTHTHIYIYIYRYIHVYI